MTITPDRLAALHASCREDFAKGQRERAAAKLAPSLSAEHQAAEPTDLEVAVGVAQLLLDSDSNHALREALRLLLRALDAEPTSNFLGSQEVPPRCPAAHPEDPTPCGGPPVVTILDATNAGADGCEHHAARLLASLTGGRVYALPDAPAGAALRVFKAAATTLPFAWVERGEGQ